MKAVKALKRLAEIETMLSKIVERYAGNERSIQEVLRDAREAVIRARKAVRLQASKASVEAGRPHRRRRAGITQTDEPPPQANAKPSKPKRRLSAAGRAAIIAASKKRWASKKAEAVKAKPVVATKTVSKKTGAKTVVARKPAARKGSRRRSGE